MEEAGHASASSASIWELVFARLPLSSVVRASEVCRHWRDIILSPRSTLRLAFTVPETLSSAATLRCLSAWASTIRSLHIRGCFELTSSGSSSSSSSSSGGGGGGGGSGIAATIASRCRSLEVVEIRSCPEFVTDELVRAITKASSEKLVDLCLAGSSQVNDGVFLSLYRCANLSAINLSFCRKLSDRVAAALVRSCGASLRRVDLSGCLRITDEAIALLASLPLTHLSVSSCHLLTDAAAHSIARACHDLVSIDFSWCPLLSDEGVVALATLCTSLTHVDFCGCRLLTDDSLHVLATLCHDLADVNVGFSSVTDNGISELAQCCLWLERVVLLSCTRITLVSARALSRVVRLRYLDIRGCTNVASCETRFLFPTLKVVSDFSPD